MTADETSPRWRPPARVIRWLFLAQAVLTLLTNAAWLRFLEPAFGRHAPALLSVALGLLALVDPGTLPRSPQARQALRTRLMVPAALAAIVVAAFALRVWGIGSGLPQSYHADEYDFANRVLKMMKRGDLNPHVWDHPSLHSYLSLVSYVVVFFAGVLRGQWQTVGQMAEEDVLYWGRLLAAVCGTAAVGATFFLGRRLFGRFVGLLAAALLAVSPGAVEFSQYNRADPLVGLLIVASVLAVLAYLDDGGRGLALGCGLLIGATISAKYNGGLVLLPFVVSVALRHRQRTLLEPDLWLGLAGVVAGFLAGSPFVLAELPRFLDQVATVMRLYSVEGVEGVTGTDNWAYHARYVFRTGLGPVTSLAAAAGLGLALYRVNARIGVFLLFPVVYWSWYSAQRLRFPSNMVPVYPFLTVLAAWALMGLASALVRWLAGRVPGPDIAAASGRVAVTALLLLALVPPAWASIRHNRRVTLPDTGSDARAWIEETLPPGTSLAVEMHGPVLDRDRYRVVRETRLITRPVASYREEGIEYLVASSFVYDRFSADHPQSRAYRELFALCPLVREFTPGEGRRFGPTIRILRVPADLPG